MTEDEQTLAADLLAGVVGQEIEIIDTQTIDTPDGELVVEITCRIEEDDVEPFAFGILYALGVLSFHEARPRGISGIDYVEHDQFTPSDFLRHLLFRRGALHLYVDYLRGRMVKTDVDIQRDGRLFIRTVRRDLAVERWVLKLQGKSYLRLVTTPPET